MSKPKVSMYWAAACGGCEVAFVNIHEKILDFHDNFELVFCPCLVDTKKKDVEAMPDNTIDIAFFNGAIRTSENEEMAHILRKKAKVLIAYGACAYEGGIPALSNLTTKEATFNAAYIDNPTIDNENKIFPKTKTQVPEGELTLPEFYEDAKKLKDCVDVDYYIPGCPPESEQVWNIINAIIQGAELPPKGSVIGAGESAVCDECKRTKKDMKVKRFYRTYEKIPDPEQCLLEQGFICMGPATRSGCGALCPQVNMPCIGCYGTPDGVDDQGAKMTAALGSIIDISDAVNMSEEELEKHVQSIVDTIPDCAGTYYKFSLANSILKRRIK
jgi:F420-non-reducing hydrogenase small subunit